MITQLLENNFFFRGRLRALLGNRLWPPSICLGRAETRYGYPRAKGIHNLAIVKEESEIIENKRLSSSRTDAVGFLLYIIIIYFTNSLNFCMLTVYFRPPQISVKGLCCHCPLTKRIENISDFDKQLNKTHLNRELKF